MSKLSCNVVKDLLPSYIDKICSEESAQLVDEHLRECEECAKTKEQMEENLLAQKASKEEIELINRVKSRKQKRHTVYIGIIVFALIVNIVMTLFVEYNLVSYPLHFLLLPVTILALYFLTGDKTVAGNRIFCIIGHIINILCVGCFLSVILVCIAPASRIKNDGHKLSFLIGGTEGDIFEILVVLFILSLLVEGIFLLVVIRVMEYSCFIPGLLCETVTGIYMVWTVFSVMYEVQLHSVVKNTILITILILLAEGILTYFIIRKIQKRREKKRGEMV